MNKIQFIGLIGALSIAKVLYTNESSDFKNVSMTSSFCKYYFEETPLYSLSMLNVVSESDTLGNTQYYFVNRKNNSIEFDPLKLNDWNYQSVTNPEKIFSNSLPIIQDIGYYWIPDINQNISIISAENFLLANGYDITGLYSKRELETIENKFNNFTNNPYLWLEEICFPISQLRMIGSGDSIFVYDIDFAVEVQENNINGSRSVVYLYNLTDLKRALKCHYGITLEEEQKLRAQNDYSYLDCLYIKTETSLYQNCEEVVFNNYDIYDYLTEEQISRGYLYYNEIVAIVENYNIDDSQQLLLVAK